MSKYIDSEKLISEIERLYEIAREESYNGEIEGEMTAYDKILSFIDSLQQEQPKVEWHPASESPGKRRAVIAFTRKDLKRGQYLFNPVRYFQEGIIPAKAEFRDHEGDKILPVAWTYYTDAVRGITAEMLRSSASEARDWWTEENECKQ